MPIPEAVSRHAVAGHASPGWVRSVCAGVVAATISLGLTTAGAVAQPAQAVASATPAIIEVQTGDTFSSIAGRLTGDPRNWRKMYRSRLSELPNPNVLFVGMRLAVTQDGAGRQYLRAIRTSDLAAATATPRATASQPATSANANVPPVAVVAAPSGVLVIGVLPNIAAATLTTQYEHLSRYLERSDGQKVRIVIAANFKEFFDRTMKGDFDLAVTAPHFARVAQLDRAMVPVVGYQPRINALLVAPTDSKVTGARELRERAVAFANPQSLVAMYGQQWLHQQGMEAGTDYEIKAARTDLGVGRMLLSGDAVAAIMSNGEFRALPPEESSRMKIVEVFARIPNFIVIAHPRIDRVRLGQLKTQLKNFLADPEDGVPFAQATGLTAITDPDETQLRELDSFAGATRRSMGYDN